MSEEVAAVDPTATVTVEHEGRTLSGVGVESARLTETMDRRTSAPEAQPAVETPPASTEPQLPPTRGQKRFSELTQARKDAEARAESIQREYDEFRAKFVPPENRQQAPASAPALPPAAPVTSAVGPERGDTGPLTRPKPTEDEVGTKYATYGDYVDDLSDWKLEQRQASLPNLIQQTLQAQHAQQALMSHVESTRAKGRAVYKDFDMLLQHGAGTYVNMPPGAIQTIYSLPNSEHVQYAIMKDGLLAQRLADLAARDPYAFSLELLKIAPAAPAVSTASTGNTGSVTPPAPMKPVGSGSTTTSLSSAEHAKAGNYLAYKAARSAERGGGRRR